MVKTLYQSSFETKVQRPWALSCNIGDVGHTKFIQTDVPSLTLTYFIARSNLPSIAFYMEILMETSVESSVTMRGSRDFRQGGGGVQVSLTKKNVFFFVFFLVLSLFLQKSNGQFQRNLSFSKVPEGVQHFPGGGGGGGSNCLFPIEVILPGGRTPCPPTSGSALELLLETAIILTRYFNEMTIDKVDLSAKCFQRLWPDVHHHGEFVTVAQLRGFL